MSKAHIATTWSQDANGTFRPNAGLDWATKRTCQNPTIGYEGQMMPEITVGALVVVEVEATEAAINAYDALHEGAVIWRE